MESRWQRDLTDSTSQRNIGVALGYATLAYTSLMTGLNKLELDNIKLPASLLTLFCKTVQGSLFGDCNPTVDIPKIIGLYQNGDIKLDELITKTYTLEQVNEGYDDLLDGKNVRGVLVHDHS